MERRMTDEQVKRAVTLGYTRKVTRGGTCCSSPSDLAAVGTKQANLVNIVGYSPEDLTKLPRSALENAFGCGNPLSFAGVKAGDIVLDVGSGAGIDCLIAADKVGPSGHVIGLDMTPAMIEKAVENARQSGVPNVEFRLGDAENMPVADASVDWVISNCVINLAPNKSAVFQEVVRVLKPGGQVSISDIVLGASLPDGVAQSVGALIGCVAGAVTEVDYLAAMREAGLKDVTVSSRFVYQEEHLCGFLNEGESGLTGDPDLWSLLSQYRDHILGNVWSARITARKF